MNSLRDVGGVHQVVVGVFVFAVSHLQGLHEGHHRRNRDLAADVTSRHTLTTVSERRCDLNDGCIRFQCVHTARSASEIDVIKSGIMNHLADRRLQLHIHAGLFISAARVIYSQMLSLQVECPQLDDAVENELQCQMK